MWNPNVWVMPNWMEKYRQYICCPIVMSPEGVVSTPDTPRRTVEDCMNCGTSGIAEEDPIKRIIDGGTYWVRHQVELLYRLHDAGVL